MVWPTSTTDTSNTDAGGDNPSIARPNILKTMQDVNTIIAAISDSYTLNDSTRIASTKALRDAVLGGNWVNLTLNTGWFNTGGGPVLRYRRVVADLVELQGDISNPLNTTSLIGTLPATFRPSDDLVFTGSQDGTNLMRVQIGANGAIQILDTSNGASVSVSGILFRAEQ